MNGSLHTSRLEFLRNPPPRSILLIGEALHSAAFWRSLHLFLDPSIASQGRGYFSDLGSVKGRRVNERRGGRGWRRSCGTERSTASEYSPRIANAHTSSRVSRGIGGVIYRVGSRVPRSSCTSFRTDAPLCEKSGCGEWREGLQRWLHCVSRQRGQGCSHGEYGFRTARYVSRLYGLRWVE